MEEFGQLEKIDKQGRTGRKKRSHMREPHNDSLPHPSGAMAKRANKRPSREQVGTKSSITLSRKPSTLLGGLSNLREYNLYLLMNVI